MSNESAEPQKIGPEIPPIISFNWIRDEFEKLHKEHVLIIKSINDLAKVIGGGPNTLITPELAEQVKLASAIALKIDLKVPDKNVPPGPVDNK